MRIDLGDHVSVIPINTNLPEEGHRLLEVSLSNCQKDPNQWSTDEWIEALAGALIHRYFSNDGSTHPAIQWLLQHRAAIQGLLEQVIKSDQLHPSLSTLLAVQMMLSLDDRLNYSLKLSMYGKYLTGIVDHNINEFND